jgi:hypothetical protein
LGDNLTVEADIGFLAPGSRRPIFHDEPSSDDFLPLEQHRVTITALRDGRGSYRLDRHGIEVVHLPAVDKDLASSAGRAGYLRTLERKIGDVTGASRVVALGNGVVRRSERAPRHRHDGTTVLGRFAHCDFTRTAAGSRLWVEKLLPKDEARECLSRRYALYNVWQSLSEPPQDTPLAFCDPASTAPDEFVGCDQVMRMAGGQRISFELGLFHHGSGQRWFYFPNLRRDELLIFTGYDSDALRPQGIAHAAFTDPSCPADAPARESIDERLIAFFD